MRMICNPYAEKPFPKILIDNKPLTPNSSLARVENKPLQESLYPSSGWKGLFQTIYSSLGIDRLEFEFCGSLKDFTSLKKAYELFVKSNGKLTVDFIVDRELAADISPDHRKQFLLDWLMDLRHKYLDEFNCNSGALQKCIHFLSCEKTSDAEKILECKSFLEKYFREQFQDDANEVRSYIGRLNRIRTKKFESGQLLSLTEARKRWLLARELCDCLSLLSSTVAQEISDEAEVTAWTKPDFFLAKTEIGGNAGYWLEETDASIQIEKFRLAVKKCYGVLIKAYQSSDWLFKIQNLREEKLEAYFDKWVEKFQCCRALKNFDSFDAERTKCTVTNDVPAYFPGQTARKVIRTYVEVVEYEKKFLNAVKKGIAEQSATFLSNVNAILDAWVKDLENYQRVLNRLEKAEEFLRLIEELCGITKRLTSIDCKLSEENQHER